jgi:hypothetical protein
MNRPRIATIVSSALASALAFFIITKSGLAGTLGGAAVASIVATSTSHWTGVGLEHGSHWFRRRVIDVRTAPNEETAVPEQPAPDDATATVVTAVQPVAAPESPVAVPVGSRTSPTVWRRRLVTWGPLMLGMLALGVSAFTLATGTPLERVVVRERVVEKPKVVEHVVVEKQTVVATAPTRTSPPPTRTPAPAVSPATDSTPSATTTTAARATTTTTVPRATTTTTAPRPTTTTAPRPVTTTSPPSTTPPSTAPARPTP